MLKGALSDHDIAAITTTQRTTLEKTETQLPPREREMGSLMGEAIAVVVVAVVANAFAASSSSRCCPTRRGSECVFYVQQQQPASRSPLSSGFFPRRRMRDGVLFWCIGVVAKTRHKKLAIYWAWAPLLPLLLPPSPPRAHLQILQA